MIARFIINFLQREKGCGSKIECGPAVDATSLLLMEIRLVYDIDKSLSKQRKTTF